MKKKPNGFWMKISIKGINYSNYRMNSYVNTNNKTQANY